MRIAFAGFRHSHIVSLYETAQTRSDVTVVGCWEEDEATRNATVQSLNANFCYADYAALLADPAVEVVAIGDYYAKRGQLVIEALKNGKHVICDKPVCTDLSELDEIERLTKETGLQVCCMLDLRYMEQVAKAKELVASGVIGDVKIATFTGQHCLSYGTRPNWYFEDGKHGGTINDIAIHGVDLVRYITGKNLTGVNYAKTWNAYAVQVPSFKDCGQFVADLEGMTLNADVSYAAPSFKGTLPTYWDFYFWGLNGMIHFNLAENKTCLYKDGVCETFECGPLACNYFDDVAKMINGEPTIFTTEDVLKSQRQVLTIQKAAE
ncbi:MAG: Gfo/Idh/MocA family oxidoreductase [Ruminococcaceae bacterium]|nr:Gfo/Idh/MocA family oxidoreductase [Oscillospiraceae bacterium]